MRALSLVALVFCVAACADGPCADAPYASFAPEECNTCPKSWWDAFAGGPGGQLAGAALARVSAPEDLPLGRASWLGASDGELRWSAAGADRAVEVPGLEAEDLAWLPMGSAIVVLPGPDTLTIRQDTGPLVFQSIYVGTPLADATLRTDEGPVVAARRFDDFTCERFVSPCWSLGLLGPTLELGGEVRAMADVGETGRVEVGGRGYAFRGTWHTRTNLIQAQCSDTRFAGEGAAWIVATSE
ncbi:MAG: hypothetical protein AAGH15_11935 [Myxococcota bacterium]